MPRAARASAAAVAGAAPAEVPAAATGAPGFSLIEALVALVILALSLSALLSAHNNALRGAGVVDDHLQARLLAQSLLARFSGSRVPQAASEGVSGRFAWRVSMAPYAGARGSLPDAPGNWTLHELAVTVTWAPNRRITLTTLRMLSLK